MWKIDPNTNTSIIILYDTETKHVFNSGTVRGDWRRKERRE
jgi:hypothetical protein